MWSLLVANEFSYRLPSGIVGLIIDGTAFGEVWEYDDAENIFPSK